VAGVVGEAGLGKTRLCFEFLERCRAQGLQVEGHEVAHGKNIPFLPMLQVFRAYYGITQEDSDRSARDKIAGRMLLLDEAFREVLPVLFDFFAVPDPDRPPLRLDPEVRQRQLFAVLRRLVRPEIPTAPVVTLIEDLHWIDGGSEAFLEQWIEALGGTRGLLVLNFRPEYHAGWMQKSYYRRIPITPLGPEAVRAWMQYHRVDVAARFGDTAAALERARLAVELAEKSATATGRVIARFPLGLAHGLAAQWSEAIAVWEDALRISRDFRAFRIGEGEILAMLAEALLGHGGWARAQRCAAEGVAVARSCGAKNGEMRAQLALAHASLRAGDTAALAAADSALAAAQVLVDTTGARLFQPDIHEARAELARQRGDEAGYQRELREAHRLFTEMGATGHAERISRELSAVGAQPEEQ